MAAALARGPADFVRLLSPDSFVETVSVSGGLAGLLAPMAGGGGGGGAEGGDAAGGGGVAAAAAGGGGGGGGSAVLFPFLRDCVALWDRQSQAAQALVSSLGEDGALRGLAQEVGNLLFLALSGCRALNQPGDTALMGLNPRQGVSLRRLRSELAAGAGAGGTVPPRE